MSILFMVEVLRLSDDMWGIIGDALVKNYLKWRKCRRNTKKESEQVRFFL